MAKKDHAARREELLREFEPFLSTHGPHGEEAYQFNIKIQKVDIPDMVRRVLGEDALNQKFEEVQNQRLVVFANDVQADNDWIDGWGQYGRSGGWLVFWPFYRVLSDSHGFDFTGARARLKSLRKIEKELREAIVQFKRDMQNPAWWGVGPKDWMPGGDRRRLRGMGGMFDFLKKKKDPEPGGLIRLDPIEVVPPAPGGLIPSGMPPAGTFANPFDLLDAPTPSRGLTLAPPPSSSTAFDVFSPPPASRRYEEPPRRQEIVAPPAFRAPAPEERRVPRFLPSPEDMLVYLRSILNLNDIFSTIRATRNSSGFKRDLARWGDRGLPALIPIVPVSTRNHEGDIARFFGIPAAVLETYERRGSADAMWDGLFWPLFDVMSEAFEIARPSDLPGWFAMEHDPDSDEWWLVYLEAE